MYQESQLSSDHLVQQQYHSQANQHAGTEERIVVAGVAGEGVDSEVGHQEITQLSIAVSSPDPPSYALEGLGTRLGPLVQNPFTYYCI